MKIANIEVTQETVFELGRFSILWSWFEEEFCNRNCNRGKLKNASKIIRIDKGKQAKLASAVKERALRQYSNLNDYIKVGLRENDSEFVKVMQEFIERTDEQQVLGCLGIIYRIRNNFLHGEKGVANLDDQIKLFRAVNEVLENVRKEMHHESI